MTTESVYITGDCEYCGEHFDTLNELEAHRESCEATDTAPAREYRCSECGVRRPSMPHRGLLHSATWREERDAERAGYRALLTEHGPATLARFRIVTVLDRFGSLAIYYVASDVDEYDPDQVLDLDGLIVEAWDAHHADGIAQALEYLDAGEWQLWRDDDERDIAQALDARRPLTLADDTREDDAR